MGLRCLEFFADDEDKDEDDRSAEDREDADEEEDDDEEDESIPEVSSIDVDFFCFFCKLADLEACKAFCSFDSNSDWLIQSNIQTETFRP